jgi:hypothetical protein
LQKLSRSCLEVVTTLLFLSWAIGPTHNGRIVEAVIRARIEKSDGVRLQVSFGQETALIHEYQVLEE